MVFRDDKHLNPNDLNANIPKINNKIIVYTIYNMHIFRKYGQYYLFSELYPSDLAKNIKVNKRGNLYFNIHICKFILHLYTKLHLSF